MPAFCLVVVQGLVCFGLDRSQHDSLFWIDLAHLIPAFLPLFWFHRHSRRRRRLLERRPDLKSELPLRWPIIILVLSGVIFGLAAGLAAIPRLSTTLAASTTYTLDRLSGTLSVIYTLGISVVLGSMVLQSTSPSFLRAFFLVSLGTVALGQVITQAIALSTSITTNQNISLTFRSLADLNLFNATTKASLGMAISFVSLVIIFFLALSPRIPLPRTTFALLTCTKLLIQFGLSFQLPSFSLLLIRKMLDLFAFFTLSLEAVFTLSRDPFSNQSDKNTISSTATLNKAEMVVPKNQAPRKSAMKRKPGMAISTDLSPPRRLTDLADTPSTGGRTTIVQKTPVHPPQIQWTQSGEGPITPSDFGESWLSKRSDFPEFSNPQDVVRFGYAQGTEEGSVSAISRSPLVSPGQNQQAIVQQAFQDEKSPTSSTSGSEAELKTAQVVALSRETTLSPRSAHFVRSSSGTKVTLREAREKIQQLKQYEQTDTLPASNELLDDAPDEETPRAPTFLSGSHPVRMTAQSASSVYNSTRHNSVGSDMSPDASRQRSMQATIETATGMADELQQSRGPLEQTRSNEAWWSSQNTTRESRSTHTSQTWQRSSGSSTQDDEEPAFFPLPPAYRTLPYRKPTPSVV